MKLCPLGYTNVQWHHGKDQGIIHLEVPETHFHQFTENDKERHWLGSYNCRLKHKIQKVLKISELFAGLTCLFFFLDSVFPQRRTGCQMIWGFS
jgi:hypothetical protein